MSQNSPLFSVSHAPDRPGESVPKKKIVRIFLVISLVLAALLLLRLRFTPTKAVSRMYFSAHRQDFERCVQYLHDHPEVSSIYRDSDSPTTFHLTRKTNDGYSHEYFTGDPSVDASIVKIQSMYLFAAIHQEEGCVAFVLNKFSTHFTTISHSIQYVPTGQRFLNTGADEIKGEEIADNWFFVVSDSSIRRG